MRYYLSMIFTGVLLVACAAPEGAIAQNQPLATENTRTIVVSAAGDASGAPDIATISIGVTTEAATPAEAIQQNSAQIANTISTLKELGIADKDLQTASLSLNAQYDYGSNRSKPRITGYTATNSLRVILRDLDQSGAVLDRAVGAGANQLNGLQFGFSEPQPMMDEARTKAVREAARKATLLAEAAGVTLGPLLQIRDNTTAPSQPQLRTTSLQLEADAAVPIERGELSLRASVTLVYALR